MSSLEEPDVFHRSWLRNRREVRSFHNSSRLNIEHLEGRLLLATFTVNSNDDVSDGLCDETHCSLREAIEAANAMVGADMVHFAIAGSGVPTIAPTRELPAVTDPLTIDGTTQLAGMVQLDGSTASGGADGLVIVAGSSTVRGLVVNGFSARGIVLARNGGNRVEGNRIGTDVTGAVDRGNGSHGVLILDTAGNTIGGTGAEARNVISGNGGDGVQIYGSGASELATLDSDTLEQVGQIIDPDGDCEVLLDQRNATITVPGTAHDLGAEIGLLNAPRVLQPVVGDFIAEVTVAGIVRAEGDSTHPARIPFNGAGILLWQDAGNYVRLERAAYVQDGELVTYALFEMREDGQVTVARTLSLPDQTTFLRLTRHGEYLFAIVNQGDSLWDTFEPIMKRFPAAMQVGVDAVNTASQPFTGELEDFKLLRLVAGTSAGNLISGNLIGTDITGSADLGNSSRGVVIRGSDGNTIGGPTPGARNVVSGNDMDGIYISDNSIGNAVQGNLVGTDAMGSGPLPNSQYGVVLLSAAQANLVGTDGDGVADTDERNIISGNGWSGVGIILSGTDRNVVAGNYIGTDATGITALGNANRGVDIGGGAKFNVVGSNGDGVADASERNVISGNGWEGIAINGAATDENVVAGNLIGTDTSGLLALGNAFSGVVLFGGAQSNRIGTNGDGVGDAEERNLISGNGHSGITILTSATDRNVVAGNFIGTELTGTSALSNGIDGVLIYDGASNNSVGGTSAAARNIISGNQNGVRISGTDANGNMVQGNFIGTDLTGSVKIGNSITGVGIDNIVTGNVVGGSVAGAGNVISGNAGGVRIVALGANGNLVQGNLIGTDFSGTAAIGNRDYGVLIDVFAADNTVGGAAASARNIISGNDGPGVWIDNATSNAVFGNFIGTDKSGTADLGNRSKGVLINGAAATTIGGAAIGAGNVISGNDDGAIQATGVGATGTVVQGNLIGTDVTGTQPLGNSGIGVWLEDGASHATIGGTVAGARNVIAAGSGGGIFLARNAGGSLVQGNLIGTDASGTVSLGNNNGIAIVDSPNNTIGGPTSAARNVISGNTPGGGIQISGGVGSTTDGNLVQGNFIGTDVTGTVAMRNAGYGILLDDASRNTIGGTAAGAGNVISNSGLSGVSISRFGSTANVVQGNFIGTDVTGTVRMGNGSAGVEIKSSSDNTIGGLSPAARNLISANGGGVTLEDGLAAGNLIQGNFIGTDITGTNDLGNTNVGMLIRGNNNTIGGTAAGAANIIAHSGAWGVVIVAGIDQPTRNAILSNSIFSNGNLGIDLNLDGVTLNDPGDGDTGANSLQNFPILTSAKSKLSAATISGTLNSAPRTAFRIEFFANDVLAPSGNGEGQRFLGAVQVQTSKRGRASISARFVASLNSTQFVTATATDPNGNTSEFSPGLRVVQRGRAVQSMVNEREASNLEPTIEIDAAMERAIRHDQLGSSGFSASSLKWHSNRLDTLTAMRPFAETNSDTQAAQLFATILDNILERGENLIDDSTSLR